MTNKEHTISNLKKLKSFHNGSYGADIDRAIKALEQEPCKDCIGREEAKQFLYERLDRLNDDELYDIFSRIIDDMYNELPPVTPQQKMGRWILTQRDKYIDINCSECGSTRLKDFAYGYIVGELDIKEINDLIMKLRMNYCECCGAKMQEVEE